MNQQILDILIGEFSSYYSTDELPKQWDESSLKVELPRLAQESANRLKRRAGANNITLPELSHAIGYIRQAELRGFAQHISGFNNPDWHTAENLNALNLLLEQLLENLETAQQG